MTVFIATQPESPPKVKGDLLESLAAKLLNAQNYNIENRNIRKAGMEIDLECRHKVNQSRKIYVECKAYQEDNTIDAGTIKKLFATRAVENYDEAWLVTSSTLGSDAKGFIEKIKTGNDSNKFAFYTSEMLIEALIDAGIIVSKDRVIAKLDELKSTFNKIKDIHLLVCDYGVFWIIEYLKNGKLAGFICCHANNAEIVIEDGLLENISNLDFKYANHDFGIIYRILDPNDKTIEARKLRGAGLSIKYLNIANESGLTIASHQKRTISIEDVFVYPDIEKIDIDSKKDTSEKISSEKIISFFDKQRQILIFGDDLSGKTTLSYILQKKLSTTRTVVLRLDANIIRKFNMSTINKSINKAFINQYDVTGIPQNTIEAYLDDIKAEVVLIIDDLDRIQFKKTTDWTKLLIHLKNFYGGLIVLANTSKELQFTTSNEGQATYEDFTIYRILQLGHTKRDQLIEKWISLNTESPLTSTQMLVRKDDFAKKVNAAIGINYLPTYPFYSLTILEMLESGSKAKLQGSEYAELYGYFITHALMSNHVRVDDLGFYSAYLAYLANELYERQVVSLKIEVVENIFTTYLKIMGLNKPFDTIHRNLIASKILRLDEEYSFNLNYYRYYFFAKYLSDNIEDPSAKNTIRKIVENLHLDENANTVIFLVHHSKNSEIIDTIVQKAKSQFEAVKLQSLSHEDIVNINNLINEDIKFALQDGSVAEHRKKRLKRQDVYENSQIETSNGHESILDVYGQITLALRTIDVLGKITSNYYGEMKAERKTTIMQELYELGFRSLHAFLESFESYTGALRSHLEAKIDDKKIGSDAAKKAAANQIIYTFTHIITYSFIKRISDSVVSPNLIMTIDAVLDHEAGPAAQLTSIATKLNFPGGLKVHKDEIIKFYSTLSGNSLAKDLLRFMVLEHLYKFEVESLQKQAICSQLNIDINTVNRRKLKNK